MHLETCGVILRAVDYKESDKILTVLTGPYGLITVKAQGCRRKNSPLAAPTQLFVYAQMTLFAYRDRLSLKEAVILDQFLGVREDIAKLALASYFAEVAQCVGVEGESNEGLVRLVLNSFYALDKLDKPLELIRAAFDLKCMALAGYAPLLDACAVCGASPPAEPMLNLQEGVLHCRACKAGAGPGRSVPLTGEMLSAARHVVCGQDRRLFSFRLPPGQLAPLAALASDYLTAQLDRRFQTLELYLSLVP